MQANQAQAANKGDLEEGLYRLWGREHLMIN